MPILTFWVWTPSGASARADLALRKGFLGWYFGPKTARAKVIHNSVAVVDNAGIPLCGLKAAYGSDSAATRAGYTEARQAYEAAAGGLERRRPPRHAPAVGVSRRREPGRSPLQTAPSAAPAPVRLNPRPRCPDPNPTPSVPLDAAKFFTALRTRNSP
jgi:hypothetical protein